MSWAEKVAFKQQLAAINAGLLADLLLDLLSLHASDEQLRTWSNTARMIELGLREGPISGPPAAEVPSPLRDVPAFPVPHQELPPERRHALYETLQRSGFPGFEYCAGCRCLIRDRGELVGTHLFDCPMAGRGLTLKSDPSRGEVPKVKVVGESPLPGGDGATYCRACGELLTDRGALVGQHQEDCHYASISPGVEVELAAVAEPQVPEEPSPPEPIHIHRAGTPYTWCDTNLADFCETPATSLIGATCERCRENFFRAGGRS